MKLRPIVISLVSSALAMSMIFGAPILQKERNHFSYPLEDNVKLVYLIDNKIEYACVVKNGTKSKDGHMIINIYHDDSPLPNIAGRYSVSDNMLTSHIELGNKIIYDPGICLLKFPLTVDDKWASETTIFDKKFVSSRVVKGTEEISIPYGKIIAWKIEVESQIGSDKPFVETEWYSSGIGLVKWKTKSGVWELKKRDKGNPK
jgi:hypothetical protein